MCVHVYLIGLCFKVCLAEHDYASCIGVCVALDITSSLSLCPTYKFALHDFLFSSELVLTPPLEVLLRGSHKDKHRFQTVIDE